jgi:hypothetical protein
MELPELNFTQEGIPARDLRLDNRVNPRDPSTAWARRQFDGGGYSRALLGVLIVSERLTDKGRELILLDGANRKTLVEMADDADYPIPCIVFHGLSLEQEAQVASEYNDRREWSGVRKFQALVTMGDPTARRILEVFEKQGWRVGTDPENGVIRGVRPIEKLLLTAGQWAVEQAGARKGTEAWNAAMENGKNDAFRVLEQAVSIYNAVFPDKPSGYAPDIMNGLSMVLLRHEGELDLQRLTEHLAENARGHRSFRNDARSTKDTYKFSMVDAYAFLVVTYYNIGYKTSSKGALPNWAKTTR